MVPEEQPDYRPSGPGRLSRESFREGTLNRAALLVGSLAFVSIAQAQNATTETPFPPEEVEVIAPRYNVASESTATKTNALTYQVPLSVDVVPGHLISDKAAFSLEEVLSNVGVTATDTSGWGAKTFIIRGFQVNNYYVDGVKQGNYVQLDPALIQQIEVLRGAAGSVYGRLEPGGVVNVVTKQPSPVPQFSIEQTLGSFTTSRTVFEATGPLGTDKLLYQVIFAYQYNNSFRDTVNSRHLTIAPMLSWLPSSSDRIDLKFVYQNFVDTVDYGLALVPTTIDENGVTTQRRIPDISKSVYFGPADNQVHADTYVATLSWAHRFGENWRLLTKLGAYRVVQTGTEGGFTDWVDQPETGWGTASPALANIYVGNPSNFDQHQFFAEVDLTGNFSAVWAKHDLLVSAEYFWWKYQYDFWSYGGEGLNPIDVKAPVYQPVSDFYTSPSSGPATVSNSANDRWVSVTVQDMMTFGDWLRVLVGLRYDASSTSNAGSYNYSFGNGTYGLSGVTDSRLTPRVGGSADLTRWLAFYGSYSQAYGANDFSVLYDGSTSESQTSTQWEVGLKAHWFGDHLVGRLTYFDLVKNNVVVDVPASELNGACVVPDPNVPLDCLAQLGSLGSRGVEFEVAGRVTDWLSLNVYYQYVDATVRAGGDTLTGGTVSYPVGRHLPDVPKHFGSLWLQYTNSHGWGVGFGAEAASSRPYDLAGTLSLPAFVRLDANASYSWKLWGVAFRAQVNVKNLTNNSTAYDIGWAATGVLPPQPLAVFVTLGAALRLER